MIRHRFFVAFRSYTLAQSSHCTACPKRTFTTAPSLRAASNPFEPKQFQHRLPEGRGDEEFVPQVLGRPIGFPRPPRAGENTGEDGRSLRERMDDLGDREKHLEKRRQIQSALYKPYFMDFRNMKYEQGKAFLGNPKMFKSSVSQYFPNFHGNILAGSETADTTPILEGKISIVNVFSSDWGLSQIKTFVEPQHNPAIEELLGANPGVSQRVDINIEENSMKQALLLYLLKRSIRNSTPKDRHDKYFIVTKGVSTDIRETIGLINSKVGFVYLVDEKCRIRWAACADASAEEKETLARSFRRLIETKLNPAKKTSVGASEATESI